jgi:hypothetical protein
MAKLNSQNKALKLSSQVVTAASFVLSTNITKVVRLVPAKK